jgi:Ser/Thr protein kinase RdoA (MazF antagonist)
MYRVVTNSGEQLVLRVGTPHANTRSNIEFEIAWLDALNQDTSLDLVTPIRTAGNGLIVDEMDPVLGKERPCVLFSWVPGVPLGEGAGTFGYRLLGQMSAALQSHGRTWTPPPVGEMRQWDRVFYYDSEMDPMIVNNPLFGHLFDIRRQRIIEKATVICGAVIEESWASSTPQVVHGDLHEWNVHVVGSRLYAFDFEDVMMALPAQDAAICLYQTRHDELRHEIQGAYRKGFETIAEWPIVDDSQLDGFHAARQIMLMNYAARTLAVGEAMEYLDHVMPWIEGYLSRYG